MTLQHAPLLDKTVVPGTPADTHEKKVVILENPADVESFLSLKDQEQTACLICIATTPEVCFLLDKHNEHYVSADEFLGIDEMSLIGMGNFDTVDNMCEIIDTGLHKDRAALEKYSIKPAHDNYQYIKVLYDVLTIKISMIDNIIKKERPSAIITFSHDTESDLPEDLPFSNKENIFDLLLSQNGWPCRHLSIQETPSPAQEAGNKPRIRKSSQVIKTIKHRFPAVYSVIYVYHISGGKEALRLLSAYLKNLLKSKKTVCVSGFGYDWTTIFNDLAQHGFRVIFTDYEPGSFVSENLTFEKDFLKNFCSQGNVDFSGIFLARLLPMLEKAIKISGEYPSSVEKQMKKYKPCAVLCGTKINSADHIAARIARKKGIPVLSWQHGAAGFFHYPLQKYTELDGSTIHLVWGSGVKKQIEKEFPEVNCSIVPVGSFSLQKQYQSKNQENIYKIAYATTNYYHNLLYFGFAHKLQDNTFWLTQKRIIDRMGSVQEKTALKLHPGDHQKGHIYSYIEDKKYSNISLIKNECSFSGIGTSFRDYSG